MSDDIINELVHMDEEARGVVANAEKQRTEMRERITKEVAEIQENYLQRAHKRIDLVRERAQRDSEEQIEGLRALFDSASSHLDDSFQRENKRWVDEMVEKCKCPELTK